MGKTILLFLIISLSLASIAYAQEAPKYNFGSAQGSGELTAYPGEEISTILFFYNIFGNRITHISLSVSEAPENWEVTFNPPLHTTTVRVSGIETNVTENLFVEPSEAVNKTPEDVPEGIEYITSTVGLIGAKPVVITIKIPEDEQIGKVATVSIDGMAKWLGQSGAVAFNQARTFSYKVTVLAKEFSETIVKPQAEAEKAISEGGKEVKEEATEAAEGLAQPVQPEVVEQGQGAAAKPISGIVPLLVIIIILMAAFIVVLIRKKR